MRTARRYPIPLPALLVLLALAAACSSGDDDDALRAKTESIDPSAEGGGGDGDGSSGQGDGSGDGEVIGTAKATPESAAGGLDPMRIDVLRLERDGRLVQLDIALVNEGDDTFTIGNAFADRTNEDPRGEIFEYRSDASNIGLVDGAAQKVYLPVLDSERACLCSSALGSTQVKAGETFHLVATYGGVPDAVDALDVSVPGFPVITGVPLG